MEANVAPYWLTLLGAPGVGKTMLAKQIFSESQRCNPGDPARAPVWMTGHGLYNPDLRRPNCVWFDAPKFKDRLLGGEFDLPEYLRADFMVAIDDLGATRDTKDNGLADGLYRLANHRLGRWTIWTSNLTIDEISARIDARLSSRLIRDENRLLTITAPDYALVPKK